MTEFTFTMPEAQARNIHRVVDSHCQALKNWIAGRVDSDDLEGAKKLVAELKQFQALYAAFNIDAKYDIAKFSNKPLRTEVDVDHERN